MKKRIVIFILFIFILSEGYAADRFREICKKYSQEESVMSMRIGKFGCFLLSFLDEEEEQLLHKLARNSNSCHVLLAEKKQENLRKDIRRLIRDNNLEELMSVRKDKNRIKVFTRERDEIIREVFITIETEDSIQVFVQVKGKYDLEMLRKLISIEAGG